MSSLWADLRFALRMMAKTPGFTAVLVITLALGIGASTTIFSVVNSVVMKPLPYKDPERLARVYTEFIGSPKLQLRKFWMSTPEYWQLERECQGCASIAGISRGTAALAGGDRAVRVDAGYMTHTMLPTLGVEPILGRNFTPEEDAKGTLSTVILGHGVWKRAFGGDPGVIGRKILLDAIPVTVIGVMPEGFDFPGGIEAWGTANLDPASERWGGHFLEVYARARPGVSFANLRAEITGITERSGATKQEDEHRWSPDKHPLVVYPLHDEVVGSLSTTLWLLQGAVLLVLLIAIANITNLLLARAESRSREVAVRHALGATRLRLVRQLVTESLVLGVLGGGLGVLVAVWALDATVAMLPPTAPRLEEIALDGNALLFAAGLTVASSLLFGLAPILHTRRTDVHRALKDGSPRTAGSKTRLRVRRALVIGEIALATVLVIGCGLMVKSFVRLQQVDPGVRPDHLLTFEVEAPQKTYPEPKDVDNYWRRLEERVRAEPGVVDATLIDGMFPNRPLNANDLGLPGRTKQEGEAWNVDYWNVVGHHAFETLGARVIRGRGLTETDVGGQPHVVVINQAFADRFFPGEDPIGQLVDVTPWDDDLEKVQTVVGVVADIKNRGVDQPAGTEVFIPLYQFNELNAGTANAMRVVVRTKGDPMEMAPAMSRILAEIDPTIPASKVRSMDDLLWEAVAKPRFLTFLLGSFAVLALLLAAVGIYGVMAYTVAQRTHEIGIRIALGAQPAQVRAMVLRQAGVLVGIGVVAGIAGGVIVQLALDRALSNLMYGQQLRDPLIFVAVSVAVVAAALLATWLPARRATRVQPTIALRAE